MAKIETSTTGAGGAAAASSGAHERQFGMWSSALVGPALLDSLRKLSPAAQMKNPVMFVVYAGSILTTILWIMALRGQAEAPAGFILAITVWLWFTVLFANFAEALAEGRGKQQAATLRGLRTTIAARLLKGFKDADASHATPDAWRGQAVSQPSGLLRRGDVVLVEAGETIPGDGQVIAGVASVDEAPSPANPRP